MAIVRAYQNVSGTEADLFFNCYVYYQESIKLKIAIKKYCFTEFYEYLKN